MNEKQKERRKKLAGEIIMLMHEQVKNSACDDETAFQQQHLEFIMPIMSQIRNGIDLWQQPQPEAQYQAKWILDDIEFGYDLESIKNKIKNNCYLNTGDTEIPQPEVSEEKPFLCPHCNLIIHK